MQVSTEALFKPPHLAAVSFVVVPGKVQHAVKDENLYLGQQVMADFGSLRARRLE
jgi:hypothetical protein